MSTASDLADHRIPNILLLAALLIALGLHLIAAACIAAFVALGGEVTTIISGLATDLANPPAPAP
ncbi:MAG: hypothetical protein P8172_16370 [Gammaproteobacteria bacterium]